MCLFKQLEIMRTITQDQLIKILNDHKLWLENKGGKRANLIGANLIGTYLRGADLSGANLRGAYFRNADLSGANLRGADLRGAKMPIFCKWSYSQINNSEIQIGCKTKHYQEWEEWLNGNEEFETKRGTEEFKQIEATIRACIAYVKTLNN